MNKVALIFAGGVGKRMQSKGIPKQFLELNGKPIIVYTIEHFENHPEIDAIAVVCIENWIPHLKKMLARYDMKKVRWIVPGGSTSQESTCRGLDALARDLDPKQTIVLIHDGVRPLIDEEVITANIRSVEEYGNAITVSPAVETIITTGDDESVNGLIDRESCRLARAPQSFVLEQIMEAHRRAQAEHYDKMIDSASLMMYYGEKLHMVQGPVENIKITTPNDFYTLRAMIEARENSKIWGL